jgi:hypothetical protein
MANKFDGYLGNTITGTKGDLGSFQHAARLYVDDNFRLAPKVKFLYYVVFNINPRVAASLQSAAGLELNYLVRSTDLPKFQIDTELFHQYNRKTHVYKKITYMPINMVMHDDNFGNVNSLWALYYGYYFADRNNNSGPYDSVFPAAYQSHTYDNKNKWPFRYGLDNDSSSREPFFHSIQLFTINRHQFNSYLLCLPKITGWDHDSVNQDDGGGTINHKLSIVYDSVLYSNGIIEEDDPAGWAVLHYDKIPSPLSNDNILKKGVEGVFGNSRSNGLLNQGNKIGSQYKRGRSFSTDVGNRSPYGYGSNSFYGRNQDGQLGGLSNLAFGLAAGATSGLINAGIGMFKNLLNGGNGRDDQSQNDTNNTGVASENNPDGSKKDAAAEDAYDNPDAKKDGDAESGDKFGNPDGSPDANATDHDANAAKLASAGDISDVTPTGDGGAIYSYSKDGNYLGTVQYDKDGNITYSSTPGIQDTSDTNSLDNTVQDNGDTNENTPDPQQAAEADMDTSYLADSQFAAYDDPGAFASDAASSESYSEPYEPPADYGSEVSAYLE